MSRLVNVNGIPEERLPAVLAILCDCDMISHVDYYLGHRMVLGLEPHQVYRCCFNVRAAYVAFPIKKLKEIGVGEHFGEIDVVQIACSTEEFPKAPRSKVPSQCPLCPSAIDRISTLEIHTAILNGSHINFDHSALIILASGIAAVGLLSDSTAFVLASFFISPLMSMILAVAWGITISDFRLARRGFRNMFYGALLSILAGMVCALFLSIKPNQVEIMSPVNEGNSLFSGISINSDQILSRGPPFSNLYSSGVVAALSGVSVALGMSSGISSALAGVAMSTSLLPPVVNCGLMLVLAFVYPDLRNEHGASLLVLSGYGLLFYAVNVVMILAFAVLTFKLKHIGGKTLRPMGRRFQRTLSQQKSQHQSPASASHASCAIGIHDCVRNSQQLLIGNSQQLEVSEGALASHGGDSSGGGHISTQVGAVGGSSGSGALSIVPHIPPRPRRNRSHTVGSISSRSHTVGSTSSRTHTVGSSKCPGESGGLGEYVDLDEELLQDYQWHKDTETVAWTGSMGPSDLHRYYDHDVCYDRDVSLAYDAAR
jgi:uncharacterized membrane protein